MKHGRPKPAPWRRFHHSRIVIRHCSRTMITFRYKMTGQYEDGTFLSLLCCTLYILATGILESVHAPVNLCFTTASVGHGMYLQIWLLLPGLIAWWYGMHDLGLSSCLERSCIKHCLLMVACTVPTRTRRGMLAFAFLESEH